MANTIGQEIEQQIIQDTKFLSNLVRMQAVMDELKLSKLEAYVSITSYCFGEDDYPVIRITPAHVPGIALVMARGDRIEMPVVDTSPTLSHIARLLLSKVKKLDKSFDGERNQIILTCVYRDIKIIVQDYPPSTCSVETVVEEVDVPEEVRPAHKETRTRYRMVDDCDPILTDKAEIKQEATNGSER